MKYFWHLLLLVVIIAFFWVWLSSEGDEETSTNDSDVVEVEQTTNTNEEVISITESMAAQDVSEDVGVTDTPETDVVASMVYQYEGTLVDVAGGSSSGTAKSTFDAGAYMLMATVEDLPALKDGFFYEGWVVRQSPFDFISTGVITQGADGVWVNTYQSTTDYTDYDFYVVTLEPDDGDPAPAAHITEGTMLLVE